MRPPAPRSQILHALGALVAGGAERACVDLALAQKRAGLDVAVACLSPRRDSVGDAWLRSLGAAAVPVVTGPTHRVGFRTVLWLRGQLVRPELAILHIHLDNVVLAYHLARKLHPRRYGVLRKLASMHVIDQSRLRWAVERCDIRHLVAGGESTARNLAGRFPGSLYCIPNGMSFHWPIQSPAEQARAREALQLDPVRRHWLMVGRMSGETPAQAQKAYDTLIAAWRRSEAGNRGAQLHLLGDGELRPALEALAADDPSIRFHGAVSGVERWLLACDGFFLCTRWEGLPNAAIEAAGTGLPMLVSDIPPCREIGSPRAQYLPADDVAAWADAIAAAVASPPAQPLDDEPIRAIRRRYGIDRPLRDYAAVYREIWPGTPPEPLLRCLAEPAAEAAAEPRPMSPS